MADKELEQVVDTEAAQLDEFKATGDASMVADPVPTKSNKRPADKDGGDKAMPTLSRAGMIGAMVQKLSGFSKGGVNDAYSVIFGKAAKDTSAKNMASIAGKAKFKEDVAEIFDGQELAEEFLDKAAIIFEASVMARVLAETARIEEEFAAKLEESTDGLKEEMTDKVDNYLSYVAEQWMEENEIAIESSLKVDIAENFMSGLKELFENNYVTVPDEKLDLAADAIAMSEELESKLDASITEKIEMQKEIESLKVKNLVSEQSDGLSISQREKLSALVEGIEYNDADEFSTKLNVIKNQYFASTPISEEVDETPIDEAEEKAAIDPLMGRYASAISRTIKK
jgi:hypothetical protein|tara:strand:- start:7889 stop:8911 length:1023 start_codon:yes stop_codon:yes gene_type:complete